MPHLMIACPVTRHSVPTNRRVRREDLATIDLGTNIVERCPCCQGSHTRTIRNAYPAGTPHGATPGRRLRVCSCSRSAPPVRAGTRPALARTKARW